MTESLKEQIKLRDNETNDEYEARICSLHDEYNLSWDDITAIINSTLDYNYTESRYRKMWKMYTLGVRNTAIQRRMRHKEEGDFLTAPVADSVLVENSNGTDGEVLTEDSDMSKEAILRQKYATTSDRLSYTRELRQDARFERFYQYIASAIKESGKLEIPMYVGPRKEQNEKEYVLPLADLHLGAIFASINNVYSINEAQKRMEAVLSNVITFIQEKRIKRIKILSLGDLVQGILRISDLALNEKAVSDAFVIAIRLLAGFLNSLSAYCYIDYIHVCYSNHEQIRPLGSKASELAAEDMGKISFAYLQDVLAMNPRVNVIGDPNKDYYIFDIFGFKCFAAHGHQIKNLKDVGKDLANRHRIFFDYIFLGHSHSAKEFIFAEGENHDAEVLVAPSLIGSDPYSDKLFVGSKASIKIFGFDSKYGHTESYKFILN